MRPHNIQKSALDRDPLSWLLFEAPDLGVPKKQAERQRATARRLLKGLYGSNPVPGIILGDEVGMGKTYETFGVIAALLRHIPNARIVVLAHSFSMSEAWLFRWNRFRQENVTGKYRNKMTTGRLLSTADEIGKPGLFFGSYETFKRASTDHQRAMLEWVLNGSGLHESTRKGLRWELFRVRRKGDNLDDHLPFQPSQQACLSVLKLLNDETRHPYRILHELRRMVLRCFRTRRHVDLLIVDEAHKVRDGQREVFFTEVLNGRADKVLYVTATPFALDLDQLVDLVEDMFECVGAESDAVEQLRISLDQFRAIVESRAEFSQQEKARVQKELGAYLVRSCWPSVLDTGKRLEPGQRRVLRHLKSTQKAAQSEELTLASLALETAFRRLQDENTRTHRATHRETLCSSYAAIREAAERSKTKTSLPKHLQALTEIIPSNHESPKFETAAEFLQNMALKRHKVVVFCKRLATVRKLRNELNKALQAESIRARKLWKSALRKLSRLEVPTDIKAEITALTRMAIYSTSRAACPISPPARRKLEDAAEKAEPDDRRRREFLRQTWGPHRRIDWVAELSGDTRQDESGGRSPEAVRFAFNLPGPPYILICTNIAREGIDLHYWCRHVMHYDLEWNPAFMEQQVGRVDRLGSYSSRVKKPIEILFVYQPKTYEERIAQVVQHRCEMLRILLGAGQWLAGTPEEQSTLSDLDKYRLDFSPQLGRPHA